jgi:hypothetical protein
MVKLIIYAYSLISVSSLGVLWFFPSVCLQARLPYVSLLLMIQDAVPTFQLPISSCGSVDVLQLVLYSVLPLHGGCSRSLTCHSWPSAVMYCSFWYLYSSCGWKYLACWISKDPISLLSCSCIFSNKRIYIFLVGFIIVGNLDHCLS